MRARLDPDRLAVCTFEQAGEEIPNGDPSVTDAERAAAGRETLAERFAAVLPGRAGLPCRHEEWTGGHDQVWWERQLPVALGWLLQA